MNVPPTLEEVIPRLRGVMHAYAFWFAAVAAAALVALAPTDRGARRGRDLRRRPVRAVRGQRALPPLALDPRWKPLLRRLDHSTIYLFIAATTTPIALLVLSGTIQVVVLASVWAGAALGIAFALAWIDAPRLLVAGHVPGGRLGGASSPCRSC